MTRKPRSTRKGQEKGNRRSADKKPAKASVKARKKTTAKKKAKKAPAKARKKAPAKPQVYAHIFDNPKNVKRAIYALFAVCGVTFVLDFFVSRYVDHPWEGMFGFYAVYGFVVCMFLVLAAKEMRKVVRRKEDYYDE